MVDDSLKEYWLAVSYYHRQPERERPTVIAGFLTVRAMNAKRPKSRDRLSEFLAREKFRHVEKQCS